MDARLLPRGLASTLPAARADTPVVCLLGRRQCGKTTLVRTLVPGHGYVTFDDEVWPERVIPKCATDRSLAIAQGLDAIFWRGDPEKPGKWIARKVTDLELRGLIAEHTSAAVKATVESLIGVTSNEGAPRRGRKGAKA